MTQTGQYTNGETKTSGKDEETTLGKFIQQARNLKGLSLAKTAKKADISAAYQKKLEADEVKQPSPHMLRSVADALGVQYVTLMQLAGYIMPGETQKDIASEFGFALNSADLTEDERKAVAAYIALLRQQREST
jgi:transcriptional regulator with XRE-family HTH domain